MSIPPRAGKTNELKQGMKTVKAKSGKRFEKRLKLNINSTDSGQNHTFDNGRR